MSKAIYRSLLLFVCFCFLTSCCREMLSVHTDYLSRQNLASYHVGTPDPALNNPPIGQRLIVSWSVLEGYVEKGDLKLQIKIRFRNKEDTEQTVELCKKSGIYVYSLLNDDYFATEGILTYKVELWSGCEMIHEWVHQLWVERIHLQDEVTEEIPAL